MIRIENPCHENLTSMSRCGSTVFCGACQKNVHDLRNKSTAEVKLFVESNQQACVIVSARHEKEAAQKLNWINQLEARLLRTGWKRTAFAATMILLFLASCASRRKPHVVGKFNRAEKNKRTEQVSTLTK